MSHPSIYDPRGLTRQPASRDVPLSPDQARRVIDTLQQRVAQLVTERDELRERLVAANRAAGLYREPTGED